MPRSRTPDSPSPAELDRAHRGAVEARVRADYERLTGEPWDDQPNGSKVEYRAMAERALRSEAALADAPPADPAPVPSPSPAPAPAARPPDVDGERDYPLGGMGIKALMKSIARPIRDAIEARADPLRERAASLEARLANAEARLAELERER